MTEGQEERLKRIEDKLDLLLKKAEINWVFVPEVKEEKQQPLDPDVWPDWYADLYSIPGFKRNLIDCRLWLDREGITETKANETAAAVKSKYPGTRARPIKDIWATFRNWILRPPLPLVGNGRAMRAGQISTNPEDFRDAG